MRYDALRQTLKDYYWEGSPERAKAFADKCFAICDERVTEEMSPMQQKVLQYRVITEQIEPVLFANVPFYYETGALVNVSDGCHSAKGQTFMHAAGWLYKRNYQVFIDQDPELCETRMRQMGELLYLLCGPYNDTGQHFQLISRPILKHGLRGVYEEAQAGLLSAETEEQKEFLQAVCDGMLQLKTVAEKFADKAKALLQDDKENSNYRLIAQTAARVPWGKPESLYEALNTLLFLRTVIGTLEGIGLNSFGRLDMDLYPFYQADLEKGSLTEEGAYDLIAKFLLVSDMHYDHDMLMEGYADHELENTYTLGGCDLEGKPLYNELTQMFLRATREEAIIFPKIKCRFSKNSPKEYLDEINQAVIKGTSTILYQNDDATIPALVRAGRTPEEARDYYVSGCWDVKTNQEKSDCGNYLNLLKPFEFALHRMEDKIKHVGIPFAYLDDAGTFEEFYGIVVENCRKLMEERMRITRTGGHVWHKVDPLPLFSSTLDNCLEKKADYTRAGGKYRDDFLFCFGFPEIVDSLMAIKTLVYDTKTYTLAEFLDAVRSNWEGREDMRTAAIKCHGWGDGHTDSCALANRFNNDLRNMAQKIEGGHGGKVHIGHLTYTEIRWWGAATKATPNGRKDGDYFAQGLTPSRLKKIPSATSVINSLACLDKSSMAANNVVNIILPSSRMSLDVCEAFLRTVADSAVMSLQLNCVTKEQLLDAQKHPENYPNLIVRVCGFSAKFTSLSPGWQEEVLSRNFYE